MNSLRAVSALAPFSVRSFRFQWPADLFTSWAFEAEILILGWYVLVATGSVQLLVLFGALTWLGSLFAPLFGVVGDRIGFRALLCVTRGFYALQAAVLALLTLSGTLQPWHVFVISALVGLVRPSDQAMRSVLVGQTMHSAMLMGALGISRTTLDIAKVGAALTGTAGVALVGMGPAYVVVTAMYVAAFLLSLGVAGSPPRARESKAETAVANALAGLAQAFRYVWNKPDVLGAFAIAFLVNLLAYPFFLGLLPYLAKDVFGLGQAFLGYLALAFAGGGLAGSLVVGGWRLPLGAGRVMLWGAAAWFVGILLLGQTRSVEVGLVLLFLSGFVQSICLTPLAAVMLRSSSEEMRGRVMGMRSLAVWGLPLGMLAAGPVIASVGYSATTLIYAGLGLAATIAIGYRLRAAIWHRSAVANFTP